MGQGHGLQGYSHCGPSGWSLLIFFPDHDWAQLLATFQPFSECFPEVQEVESFVAEAEVIQPHLDSDRSVLA